MKFVQCTEAAHAAPILTIFNEAILHSTALYEYQPRTEISMQAWFAARRERNLPVIGVENSEGELMGFAGYVPFSDRAAYKYTVEHSVYIDKHFRGMGLGYSLMELLIAAGRQNGVHTFIGKIDLENAASIKLHEKLGFNAIGVMKQAGFKFNRWLDLVLYQLLLETPELPEEG